MARFVVVDGVLAYGGTLGIIGAILSFWQFRRFESEVQLPRQPTADLFIQLVLPTLLIALVTGLLFGIAMWFLMESLYRRHMKRAELGHA